MTKKEARNAIGINYQIEYSGVGEKIVYQSPKEGEFVKQGEKIRLMLGN